MTDYEFIGYRMNNFAGITALTGARIFHGEVPETVQTYPQVNYFLVSAPNIADGHGERRRYQINCRDDDPGDAMDLAHQVHSAFNNLQDSIGGFDVQMCYYEASNFLIEPDQIYNVPVDIFITYINA